MNRVNVYEETLKALACMDGTKDSSKVVGILLMRLSPNMKTEEDWIEFARAINKEMLNREMVARKGLGADKMFWTYRAPVIESVLRKLLYEESC